MADAIADVLRRLVRFEPEGTDPVSTRWPPFPSRPCCADFANPDDINPFRSSIELARRANLPLVAGSASEWNVAKTELPPADRHLLYWRPGIFLLWT